MTIPGNEEETGLPIEGNHSMEFKKIEIERQKLNIESAKLRSEQSKAKWSAFSGIVPLLAIIATIAFGFWTTKEQSHLSLQLEVAKAVMQSSTPDDALNRASFYRELFPEQVPNRLVDLSSVRDWGDKHVGVLRSRSSRVQNVWLN